LLAFERTADPRWRAEAEATFAFVARSLTGPDGSFYSALDAESEGEEGRYYVWTKDEVGQVLGPDAQLFGHVYGLDLRPNFPGGRNVLLEQVPLADVAKELDLSPETLSKKLVPLRKTLLEVRDRRPPPLRDDKVLTAWNGLMIAAYADGYRVLKDASYRHAADRAADFCLAKLRDGDGRLLRTYRAGTAKLPAYLEDYAFLAHGLLRLHAATGDAKRLTQAKTLADRMIADFADPANGGFFYTAGDHESLLARSKDATDNAVPSGNSVAIRVLVDLARETKDPRYLDHARRSLEAFSASLARNPAGSPLMLVALDEYLDARPTTGSEPGSPRPDKPVGVVTARAPEVRVEKGKPFEVPLTLVIAEKYHIYAEDPGQDSLIPTMVGLVTTDGVALGSVDYPKGTAKTLVANGPEKVNLYEGEVTIKLRLLAANGLATGKKTINLRVKYQACNDRACLAPAVLDVPVTLDVREKP
jgi:uncharacterized protein